MMSLTRRAEGSVALGPRPLPTTAAVPGPPTRGA